ncbi:Lrp/AsnC family transcriptional regulator [Alicycliphilus denitrificans]|uniref:Lrp/AsnC family transcriptional regulator n=1 Tax=Alicycliphilus denitrificans TaxID=179636 RepID=A0A3R7IVV1_9BURK|nr:Lrp/AsnC family transcriptional regulator [Alicycliphilus denitrificans]
MLGPHQEDGGGRRDRGLHRAPQSPGARPGRHGARAGDAGQPLRQHAGEVRRGAGQHPRGGGGAPRLGRLRLPAARGGQGHARLRAPAAREALQDQGHTPQPLQLRAAHAQEGRPAAARGHLVSGDYDYLLRVVVKDTRDYERLLREKLYKIKGIRHSRSSFVLRTLKKADLPLLVDR